jgi:putative glycosyltransferase (TIGR04348 family)
MRICLVTPAPPGSLKGNRITAERWARFLQELGHRVEVAVDYRDQPCDLLVALHAFKSYPAVRRFRDQRPSDPLVLGLTGTDLYHDIHDRPEAAEALELATRLVLLQPLGRLELPAHLRGKARVIYQSVETPARTAPARADVFEVCVMGHLRPVKDPFRTELAARLLPESSRIRVLQLGAPLGDDMAEQAHSATACNRRYHWLGELPHNEALRVLSRCQLLSLTSQLEGGANVISEALALGVPVVSSHIAGSVGLLGEDYPGYFPFGDTQALADLLGRAETDQDFYNTLKVRCQRRRALFEPDRERQSLRDLVKELFPGPEKS